MNINATLFAQFLVFFTLVWVVMKFIWPPLIKALDERRATIKEGLEAAEKNVAAKASADAEIQQLLKEARLEASEMVKNAQDNAASVIEQSKLESREAGERELDAARAKIDLEISQVRDALRKEVVALSLLGASKIVGEEVDEKTHAKMLEELASQL